MGWWRKKKSEEDKETQRFVQENGEVVLEKLVEYCDGKSNPIKSFSAFQICIATDCFSQNNSLGRPRDNSSYKCNYECYRGMLEGRLVLVKIWEPGPYSCREDICGDIAISSMVSGQNNFLKLLGCCLEFPYPVLVYEYAQSIMCRAKPEYLFDVSLPWNMRLKIAKEVADALTYLHTAFSQSIIHKDLIPCNIFLDEKGSAKLSEFHNSVIIPEGEEFVDDIDVVGNFEYLDPAYLLIGRASENTDVYGFGALMLTLLTASPPRLVVELPYNSLIELVEDGRFIEIVDPKVLESCKGEEKWQLKSFFMLSLRCLRQVGDVPKMIEVAKELKGMLV